MARLLAALLVALLLGSIYVASPFWAAWSLREAIKTGDKAYLETRVEWPSVRRSLRESLVKHAQLVPEIAADGELARPGLWQRVKMALGQSVIDSFVERYVTPSGLPQLFQHRQTYNSRVRGVSDEEAGLSATERFSNFWARLKRAEFQSLTRIEFEIEDKQKPDRRYVSAMELKDFAWRLTGLKIIAAPAPVIAGANAAPVVPAAAPALR